MSGYVVFGGNCHEHSHTDMTFIDFSLTASKPNGSLKSVNSVSPSINPSVVPHPSPHPIPHHSSLPLHLVEPPSLPSVEAVVLISGEVPMN